ELEVSINDRKCWCDEPILVLYRCCGSATGLGFYRWDIGRDGSQQQQKSIVYDCLLSCPKLFGDNKKHKMSIVWKFVNPPEIINEYQIDNHYQSDYVIIDDVKFYTQNEWPYHVNVVL
ncbi:MAG: hypothetical protein RSA26_07245, partial [Mucinivorans sp.]